MKKINDSNKSHSAKETIIIRPEQAAYVIVLMPNKSIEEADIVGINIQNDIKKVV